jgi:hypothetical protein
MRGSIEFEGRLFLAYPEVSPTRHPRRTSMRYSKFLIATILMAAFGTAVACPGDKVMDQTQSGTVSKPLAPKPSA